MVNPDLEPTVVVGTDDEYGYDVYIGRGKVFGNPIRIGEECSECSSFHMSRGGTIACFRAYFHRRLTLDEIFKQAVHKLTGKRLGCPGNCKPYHPCHGDVIAAYVNGLP